MQIYKIVFFSEEYFASKQFFKFDYFVSVFKILENRATRYDVIRWRFRDYKQIFWYYLSHFCVKSGIIIRINETRYKMHGII